MNRPTTGGHSGAMVSARAAAVWLAASALLVAAAAPGAASPLEYAGRGIYYIEGAVRSPIGDIGERSPFATNRLVLDDAHSRAIVSRESDSIVIDNSHRYGLRDLVGCLLLIGEGTTLSGRKVPAAVHLKIHKSGNRFSWSLHPHPTVREKLAAVTFERFEVVVDNGVEQRVALTPEGAVEAVRDPELSARLANLSVGLKEGVGYIGVNDRRSEIPNPAEVARAYLEYHFVGGVVAERVAELGARLASESRVEASTVP